MSLEDLRACVVKQEIQELIQKKKAANAKKPRMPEKWERHLNWIVGWVADHMKKSLMFKWSFHVSEVLTDGEFGMTLSESEAAMQERFISLGYKCIYYNWICVIEIDN